MPFHQYWLKMHAEGARARSRTIRSTPRPAARTSSCPRPATARSSPLADIAYAYHFDAGLYGQYLRRYAGRAACAAPRARWWTSNCAARDGFVEAIRLEGGERIAGDLFIDCSGFRGLLIEQALKTGYEDWSHLLPCDRAVAVPCESNGPLTPYVRCTALESGWQWRIPLQHRTGNGYVYSSQFISDDEAAARAVDARRQAAGRSARAAFHRRQAQEGLEPQRLRHRPVERLPRAAGIDQHPPDPVGDRAPDRVLPHRGFEQDDIDECNAHADFEIDRIRDFLIAHYCVTEREDTPFWRHCKHMDIPDTLRHRLRMFADNGRIFREGTEMFTEVSWLQVLHGQRLAVRGYHPLVDVHPEQRIVDFLGGIRNVVGNCVRDADPRRIRRALRDPAGTGRGVSPPAAPSPRRRPARRARERQCAPSRAGVSSPGTASASSAPAGTFTPPAHRTG